MKASQSVPLYAALGVRKNIVQYLQLALLTMRTSFVVFHVSGEKNLAFCVGHFEDSKLETAHEKSLAPRVMYQMNII